MKGPGLSNILNEATQQKGKFWRRGRAGRGIMGVKIIGHTMYMYGNVTVKPLVCIINIC